VFISSLAWNRALVPLLRWRIAVARRASARIPRPLDAPRVHAPGRDCDRVLLFGTGLAVGWGVATHALALPGFLARALTERTRRGTDVDLVAEPYLTAMRAGSVLAHLNLWRYDATIIVLGVDDALKFTPVAEWRRAMSALLAAAVDSSSDEMKIIVTGIQPIRSISIFDTFVGGFADRHARALNRETIALCAEQDKVTYVPLMGDQGSASSVRHRSPKSYAQWATVLAETLAPLLATRYHAEKGRPDDRRAVVPEEIRQQAVDELALIDRGSPARLQHILSVTQRAFGTDSVMITVLDGERQRYLAQVGAPVEETERSNAFCDYTIRGRSVMVVRDALQDDRFKDNPLVLGDPHIRFYAGFPIELPSGERIGALCVIDSQPRRRGDDIDDVLLRQFGLIAQNELWRHIPKATPAVDGRTVGSR
jgi:hypothetical protein